MGVSDRINYFIPLGKLFYPLRYTARNPATGEKLPPYSRFVKDDGYRPGIVKGRTANWLEHADKREHIYQEKIVKGYEPNHRPWMVYLKIRDPRGLCLISFFKQFLN